MNGVDAGAEAGVFPSIGFTAVNAGASAGAGAGAGAAGLGAGAGAGAAGLGAGAGAGAAGLGAGVGAGVGLGAAGFAPPFASPVNPPASFATRVNVSIARSMSLIHGRIVCVFLAP